MSPIFGVWYNFEEIAPENDIVITFYLARQIYHHQSMLGEVRKFYSKLSDEKKWNHSQFGRVVV